MLNPPPPQPRSLRLERWESVPHAQVGMPDDYRHVEKSHHPGSLSPGTDQDGQRRASVLVSGPTTMFLFVERQSLMPSQAIPSGKAAYRLLAFSALAFVRVFFHLRAPCLRRCALMFQDAQGLVVWFLLTAAKNHGLLPVPNRRFDARVLEVGWVLSNRSEEERQSLRQSCIHLHRNNVMKRLLSDITP